MSFGHRILTSAKAALRRAATRGLRRAPSSGETTGVPDAGSDSYYIRLTHRTGEKWGIWSDATLNRFAKMAKDVAGDFAEVGVAYGATFRRLVPLAWEQGKLAHAFDSFHGMAEPGLCDRPDSEGGSHPEGEFDIGGIEAFRSLMDSHKIDRGDYRLWGGFIPECFDRYEGAGRFSLTIVDVAHYGPTRQALNWFWDRTPADGLVLVGDFVIGWDMEATRAVKEFLRVRQDYDLVDCYNNQIALRKIPA
ncbi:hypothetical protein JW916_01725 [Candidatus Sumerlaeota bacterium]|nr:hypothetical protein [Candidatus Sumerlaeota bacterium]